MLQRAGLTIGLNMSRSARSLLLCKNTVGFFESFLRPDVEPEARDFPGVKWHAGIKPLDEPAGLVGVVAFGNILMDQRQNGLGIIIERDAGESAGGVLRPFLEEGYSSVLINGDGVVFFYFFEVADIIDGKNGRVFLAAILAESVKALVEQVVAGHDHHVVINLFTGQDEVEVADGAEFIGVIGGTIVDDGEG